MIIFGTRGVTTTHEKGVFYCPACGPGSDFRWRRVRRFFTLYFIPLIPLDKLGEFIECGQCKGTYDPRVLEYNPASEALRIQGLFQDVLRLVMIASLPAPLRLNREALLKLADKHESIGHSPVDIGRWERDAAEFHETGGNLFNRLKEFGGSLNNHGRETLLESGYVAADLFDHVENAGLADLAGVLGVSPAHFMGVMQTLKSSGRLPSIEKAPAIVRPPALPSTPANPFQ